MNLGDKAKENPTIKGQHRCESCGNQWFFALGEEFQCTTCGQRESYQWFHVHVAVGKWTLSGWVHQHQDHEKVRASVERKLREWDKANNWRKKSRVESPPTETSRFSGETENEAIEPKGEQYAMRS